MSGKAFDSFPLFMFVLLIVGMLVAFGASVLLPAQSVATTAGAGDNGKTITVNEGTTITVSLDENPTTGYSWNETVTSGLTIADSEYVSSGSGLIGAGGVHEWTITATGKGQQQFSAIYKRPWEPTAGNETTYILDILVK
jgi:inhibitor of cysteine peptidase